MGNLKLIVIILLIITISLFLVYAWTGNHILYKAKMEEIEPHIEPRPVAYTQQVKLYFVDIDKGTLKGIDEELTYTDNKELALLKLLLEGPKEKNYYSTIPDSTKIISVDVIDGIAFVNMSKEFQTRHIGGAANEMYTLASIVYTLTQLEEIEKVQILVEGNKIESLTGHVYTLDPLEPEDTYIGY